MSSAISESSKSGPLTAFVSFPSPYTQSLLLRALTSTLSSISITLVEPDEDNPPSLQWADYDLLTFTRPHSEPQNYLVSSYIYRKALIRKHQLHATVSEYLAKVSHRGLSSVLNPDNGGGVPRGWTVDVQFADELDELLLDELYELRETMERNMSGEEETQWFILKPGFADRAQGIRLFSTEEELRTIFESFEPPSDVDEEEDLDDDDEDDDNGGEVEDDDEDLISRRTAAAGLGESEDEGTDAGDTGVLTSQLRHFVIQEYLPRPILFDLTSAIDSPSPIGHKFHLRAYVLVTGGYTVHLARTMLALFSGAPYSSPTSLDAEELDLRPHLTNTCLQTDSYGAPVPAEDLVRLFWDLEGQEALSQTKQDGIYDKRGKVTREWLDTTFAKVGEVVAECVKAGAECGSFGLQLIPNAFEIFGVDLIVSFPRVAPTEEYLPPATVTLLEFNASPDFHQSGEKLRPALLDMFRGVIHISIIPFFGLDVSSGDDSDSEGKGDIADEARSEMSIGDERWGWRLVGKGEVRGSWA